MANDETLPPVSDTLLDEANRSAKRLTVNDDKGFFADLPNLDQNDLTRQKAVEEVVDVYLIIGDDGEQQRWLPVEMKVVRSMYDDIDTVRFVGIQADATEEPLFQQREFITDSGGGKSIKARAFAISDSASNIPKKVRDMTKLFEGEVANVFDRGDGTWFIRCTNLMARIKNTHISFETVSETSLRNILRQVLDKAQISVDQRILVPPFISSTISPQLERFADRENQTLFMSAQFDNEPLTNILGDLATRSDNVWWVTRNNELYFGKPAGTPLGDDNRSKVQQTEYIIQTEAGKKTPPYRSVRVVGDGVVSQDGWESKPIISAEAQPSLRTLQTQADGDINDNFNLKTVDSNAELEPPTFTFKSKEIKTKRQANLAAARIMDELLNQTKGGSVTMVGRPYVKPHDKLELTPRFGQAEYIVNKVTHKFNSNDGYITVVECGGLTTKDQAFYERADQDTIKKIPEAEQITLPSDVVRSNTG